MSYFLKKRMRSLFALALCLAMVLSDFSPVKGDDIQLQERKGKPMPKMSV
jgi:hypothetical protein